MTAPLTSDGEHWAHLYIHRDSSAGYFGADDVEFPGGVAPMLAARLANGLRVLAS